MGVEATQQIGRIADLDANRAGIEPEPEADFGVDGDANVIATLHASVRQPLDDVGGSHSPLGSCALWTATSMERR